MRCFWDFMEILWDWVLTVQGDALPGLVYLFPKSNIWPFHNGREVVSDCFVLDDWGNRCCDLSVKSIRVSCQLYP